MKRYELRPGEVSPKAYSVYADSSFTVWTDGNEFFLTDNGRYSERDMSASGTLEDIAEVLESYSLAHVGDLIYQLGDNGDIYESKVFRTYADDYGRTVYDTIDPISGMPGVAFDERAVGDSIFDSFSEAKDKAIERYGRYTTYEIRKQAKLKVIEALLKEAMT